jgi:DNA (cytosine-5)-methyltransferase 1
LTGGFALAASWVWGGEHEVIAFCEIDKFCQKVLKKHWPNVPIIEDVREVDGKAFGPIDLLTGGFPCQPFSCAGSRKGESDSRYLWPEMFRIISEVMPSWIIAENVPGILTLKRGVVFESVCTSLEDKGYEVQPIIVPACAKNKQHARDRVWIIAHATGNGRIGRENTPEGFLERQITEETIESGDRVSGETWGDFGGSWVRAASELCRMDDGLSDGFYEDRIRALGNAIVPQVAAQIMKAIKQAGSR